MTGRVLGLACREDKQYGWLRSAMALRPATVPTQAMAPASKGTKDGR